MSKAVHLSGTERTFPPTEIIVSKTDLKGRLVYVNELFLSVTNYGEPDVIGQPHNIIRHPDMPGTIFKMLWDNISNGKEIFAYLLNRGKFGDHYWGLAHVTPTFDGAGVISGYHSSSRAPRRAMLDAIRPLYARLRQEEQRHSNPKDGIRAAQDLLNSYLQERGLRYDQFVYSLFEGPSATTTRPLVAG